MNAFKRKSLYVAVAAGLGALGASQAGAVNLSTDNTGEVLLYPYFTVRNGFVTSFTVVNTSQSHTKAVKVRFLEGKNSAEVLDFNLFLSPRDVWAGVITDDGVGAKLTTPDHSCTAPQIPAAGQAFVNYYYAGAVAGVTADAAGGSLDRTREGYIEVIEMGVIADGADAFSGAGGVPAASTAIGSSVAKAVKHLSTGVPANCNYVQTPNLITPGTDIFDPVGGLVGNAIIINSATGTEFAYTPVVLSNFFNSVGGLASIYNEPGSTLPDLTQVFPLQSDVFNSSAIAITTDAWAIGIDAVSAVLNHSAVINEYDVTAAANMKTDWIMTAPTKRYYVFSPAGPIAGPVATSPFTNGFTGTSPNGKSCDPYLGAVYDREEAPYGVQPVINFSPIPAGGGVNTVDLCWESTVMTIAPNGTATASAASVFGSVNSALLALPLGGSGAGNYSSGWAELVPTQTLGALGGPGQNGSINPVANPATGINEVVIATDVNGGIRNILSLTTAQRYRGLPLIGFAAVQAAVSGQGYGGIFNHKYITSIAP